MPTTGASYVPTKLLLITVTLVMPSGRSQASLPLQVDRSEYHATRFRTKPSTYSFTLIARYENRTANPLYLSRCTPSAQSPMYVIPEIHHPSLDSGYDEVWACVAHGSPIVIAPGATRVDTLRIEGPNILDGRTYAPKGRLEGDFRLIYEVGTSSSSGQATGLLPLEQRSSKIFHVELGG